MKNICLLFFLSFILFSACSSDDDDNGDDTSGKVKLTATFYYLKDNQKKPDAATMLYIFKIDKANQGKYEFKTSQKYLEHKENKTVVYPTLSPKANNDGTINIEVDDKTFYQTVFVSGIQPEIWGVEYLEAKGIPLSISKEYALLQ
jgi:hypothetical protein